MECAICFNEVQKLKVLNCGHYFCETCINDLAKGKVIKHQKSALKTEIVEKMKVMQEGMSPSAPQENQPSIDANQQPSSQQEEGAVASNALQVECPQCRQKTVIQDSKGVNGLRSKFVGILNCYQCDDQKTTTEFRWCHDCSLSVCSSCYVDKHTSTSTDGYLSLHTASKWEDHKAVEFCISQLKGKANRAQAKSLNAKQYLAQYLESLQEYLGQDLDRRTRSLTTDIKEKGQKLAETFGINYNEIPPSDKDISTFSYILPDLETLVGFQKDFLKSTANEADFQIRSIPFKEMARHILSADKKGSSFDPRWFDPMQLQKKAKETMVIGANLLRYPSDVCVVDKSTVVITDRAHGIFLFKDNCILKGPLPVKHNYHQFHSVCKLPNESGRPLAMVTVKANEKPWSYIIIAFDVKHDAEQISFNKQAHWVLPVKETICLASSNYSLFGRSSKQLWKYLSPEADTHWKLVYSFSQGCADYDNIGPVIEKKQNADVYLVHPEWKCIDIVSVGRNHALWGVRRIELPHATSLKGIGTTVQTSGDVILLPVDEQADTICTFDRSTARILMWNTVSVQQEMTEIYKFRSKLARKVAMGDKCIYMIATPKDSQDAFRSMEVINL